MKIPRPAATAPLPFDLSSAIELAAKDFGVPESRLHDAITGWRESASLMKLWESFLNANPQFGRAVAA